jgi:hypothetical protein
MKPDVDFSTFLTSTESPTRGWQCGFQPCDQVWVSEDKPAPAADISSEASSTSRCVPGRGESIVLLSLAIGVDVVTMPWSRRSHGLSGPRFLGAVALGRSFDG